MDNITIQPILIESSKTGGKETRYIIKDNTTNNILDDAQGYGYKTKAKAYRAYLYKNRSPEKIKKDNEIKDWIMAHPDFLNMIKGRKSCFNQKGHGSIIRSIKEILETLSLSIECPYSPEELYWKLKKII